MAILCENKHCNKVFIKAGLMSKTVCVERNFKLDDFQEEAIKHIQDGHSVIVCAPTGAGKTIIAKEAIRQAIKTGRKAFYTAPLKALINQKYLEFSQEFGEKNIGIITGDTSANREAPIIVMTTEIYRNMLYGTSFGSLDPYLAELQYVIFDEMHYMNDSQRGTVWEESIIYSPKSIQLVGLSATINNPNEIISWIEDIHGPCKLVQTDNRPVPLHYFYFKDEQLVPLLTPNQKLNPALKEHIDNRFQKKKNNRFHHGGNQAANDASPDKVVRELSTKDMLPALYFVFSRKGCDKAAESCKNVELLTKAEKLELKKLIDENTARNQHLLKHPQLELLERGIAVHHAGQMPQWKVLIEEIFEKGLIKVVFSTETLAAGINMPARSTVISSISKISDSGHRTLKPSEFMQMSGRAGRRGMDEVGYVITIKDNRQSAAEVATLSNAKAEDINSNFSPSYEMVLNLLQRHSLDETKDLIKRSFGQAQVAQTLKPLYDEQKVLEERITDLQHPLCPSEIGDLNHYRQLQNRIDQTRSQKKKLEKELKPGASELEETIHFLTEEAQNYPCNGCPKQKPCSKQAEQSKRYKRQVKEISAEVENRLNIYWQQFADIVALLRDKKYLDDNNKPTELGKTCAALRSENSLFITEVLQTKLFNNLNQAQFASAISALAIGESRRRDQHKAQINPALFDTLDEMNRISRRVVQEQRKYRIYKSAEIGPYMSGIIEDWANGKGWDELIADCMFDDGDILKAIRRTIDVCKQISKAPNLSTELQNKATETISLLEREPVLEVLL